MRRIDKLKKYYKAITISKTRFVLTIIGMTISFFLFFICSTLYDTFVNRIQETYNSFGDDLVILKSQMEFTHDEQIFINNNFSNSAVTYYTNNYVDNIFINNKKVTYSVTGCSKNFVNNYIISEDFFGNTLDDNPLAQKRRLVAGTSWSNDEIEKCSRVVVINEFGARLIFGKNNPIGRTIEINKYNYKVIGVLENSSVSDEYLNKIDSSNDMKLPPIEAYIPTTTFNKYFSEDGILTTIIDSKEHSPEQLKEEFEKDFDKNISIYSRNSVDDSIKSQINSFLPIIIGVELFLEMISVIFLVTTMIFNVKEKIPEFGIRMSLGASKKDITLQILFEGMFYSIVSLIFSLCAFAIVILICQIILVDKVFIVDRLYIDYIHLLLISALLISVDLCFLLIPALYIRKMNILDAIKFE